MDVVANIEISSVWLADKWGNRTFPCTILFKLGGLVEGLDIRSTNLTAFRYRSARGFFGGKLVSSLNFWNFRSAITFYLSELGS